MINSLKDILYTFLAFSWMIVEMGWIVVTTLIDVAFELIADVWIKIENLLGAENREVKK